LFFDRLLEDADHCLNVLTAAIHASDEGKTILRL
jgi:hypothetical protein